MKAPKHSCYRACGLLLTAGVLLVAAPGSAAAGQWVAVAPDTGENALTVKTPSPSCAEIVVHRADETGLDVSVGISGLQLALQATPGGEFLLVNWPDAAPFGQAGEPLLPVVRRLFIAPVGATISLEVDQGPSSIIDPSALGFVAPVVPRQPSADVSDQEGLAAPFHYDDAVYANDPASPAQRATITKLGIIRGRRLHLLEVRPVAYNPVSGTLTVWPRIDARISFQGGSPPQCGPGPMLPRSGVLLNPPDHIRGGGNNYLIIVPSDFAGAAPLTQFTNAKTAAGFDVLSHTVSAGTSAAAIKTYISGLWGTADAPDYILLVGDTAGESSTSNTLPYFIGAGDRQAPTDLPYACMDGGGDWYSDIAIGRFPAASLAEIQIMVDKTLTVAGGVYSDPAYTRHAGFIAGQDADCGDEATHDWVISSYLDPRGFTSDRLYWRDDVTTEDMFTSFNAGCTYVVYFGHSSYNHWWDPSFDVDDVHNLVNDGLYSFVYSYTCYTGSFHQPECLGEAWLRVPNGGGAAYIGATSLIYAPGGAWDETISMEKAGFAAIYEDGITQVGPAWQGAVIRLIAEYGPSEPASRDYSECFNLLGDPALEFPKPASFTIQVDPPSRNICSPPDNQTFYTVQVDPEPGFSDPVTLSTSGLPVGAQSYFSVNNAVPPFTSVLTITNLSPGNFEVGIHGSGSGGASELAYADLIVSTTPPGWVGLVEPNAEVDTPLTPTLVWLPTTEATAYYVELSTDPTFTEVTYSAATAETSHTVTDPLNELTTYFWRVRAGNACGDGDFYWLYFFTTWGQPNYFTEEFAGETFDLEWSSTEFVPDGSGHYYASCGWPVGGLPTDPSGGTTLSPGNDFYALITPSAPVSLYGQSYASIYVNGNGNLTFTGNDMTYHESLAAHLSMPRVAGVFDDLASHQGGTISWKETADRVAVTFEQVPGYGFSQTVTFQIELFFDGRINITWLDVDSDDCIVGLSAGDGVPPDYVESDLSAAQTCEPACHGDLDQDGDIDLADLAEILGHYGDTGHLGYYDGDFDLDGDVDLADLAEMLGVYGEPCP